MRDGWYDVMEVVKWFTSHVLTGMQCSTQSGLHPGGGLLYWSEGLALSQGMLACWL